MQLINHQLRLIFEDLGNGLSLCKALGYDGYSRLMATDSKTSTPFDRNIIEITEQIQLDQLHRLVYPENVRSDSVAVELPPKSEGNYWPNSTALTIHFLSWFHDELIQVAFVPALGIKISCKATEKIRDKVKEQSLALMSQFQFGASLQDLLYLSERPSLKTHIKPVEVYIKTQKEREQESDTATDHTETLDKVATNLNKQSLPQAYMVSKPVKQLAKLLLGADRKSVLLTGPSGVGKTSVFYELVRTRNPIDPTRYWETSGSKLIAGMSGFGQWQDRCEKLVNELSRQTAILFVGNLLELSEVGRGGGNRQGIASYLRTYLQRGKIQVVAECTPEQYSLIEQSDPQILDCFTRFDIAVPDKKQTALILKEVGAHHSSSNEKTLDNDVIHTIDSLHRRYARYSSQPQRSILFLNNLLDAALPGQNLDGAAVIKRYSEESGLPDFMITDKKPLDLAKTKQWFTQRIIAQPEPVDLVIDLLAAVKAGLTPPDRPIASLMMIGPTGVGKTEMAKSLAHFMYGDPNKMLRFDMSEYNHPASIQRLIGGLGFGQGILTSRVRQHPFHVVLFDEIEKADHSFFDLLLQILGEGRLTDGRGQVADFTSAIVLMTSNLGVDSFKSGSLGFGSDTNGNSYRVHFVNEVRKFVRPELFNRIDRIVPFAPLNREAVLQIAKREIEHIKNRDGIRFRDVSFDVKPEAIELVAKNGFDAQLGARPLKRFIEKHLVAPTAHKINDIGSDSLEITVGIRNQGLHCQVKAKPAKSSEQKRGTIDIQLALDRLSDQRRHIQALEKSNSMIELKNEKFRLEHQMERWIKKIRKASTDAEVKASDMELRLCELRLGPLNEVIGEFDNLKNQVVQQEQHWILKFFQQQEMNPEEINSLAQHSKRLIDELMMKILLSQSDNVHSVTIVMFSRHLHQIEKLAMAYDLVAGKRGFTCRYFQLCRTGTSAGGANFRILEVESTQIPRRQSLDVFSLNSLEALFESRKGTIVGIAIEYSGMGAFPILSLERGNHIFRIPDKEREIVLIETSGKKLFDFSVPRYIVDRLGPFDWATTRRTYDEENTAIFDPILNKQIGFEKSISEGIVQSVEATFQVHLENLLDLWK